MRRIVALVLWCVACGPSVGTGAGADGGSSTAVGSEDVDGTAATGLGSDSLCGSIQLPHGTVVRDQMASSMAAVLCLAQEDCCPDARPSPSCRHSMHMGFERLDARAAELDLSYDGACVGLQHAIVGALGCEVDADPDATAFACAVYSGDGTEGASCESIGTLGSTCDRRLACVRGLCVDPCGFIEGDRPSAYGRACDADEVAVGYDCQPALEPGEVCTNACGSGSYCPDEWAGCGPSCTGLCRALEAAGSPCAGPTECASGLCIEGSCADGALEGAPCADGCAPGLSCDAETERCTPTPWICQGTAG